jgi:hypothetical protein
VSLVFIVLIALCVGPPTALAQSPAADTLAGRQLEDALRVLQAHGLRIVFSSELVTPDMRVRSEPRAQAIRERLTEVLRPHGLTAESGPGGVLQIVRQKTPPRQRSSRRASSPASNAPAAGGRGASDGSDATSSPASYRERVTVFGDMSRAHGLSAGLDRRLAAHELAGLASRVGDDPVRAVQALPGVAAGDDFRSEYSVRGSRYRHAGVVIDGVVAPWLQHASPGRGDTGTLTMVRGEVMEEAALLVGAYARRDSSQIGPQLNLTLREGTRAGPRLAASVSDISTALTAEGPVGSRGRGSWIVGVRTSHSEWPVGRSDHDSTVFGFRDLQSKVVYDVRPDQQVALTVIAGMSDVEREGSAPVALADGLNRAALVSLAWRSTVGSGAVITQRVSSLAHDFLNHSPIAPSGSRGTNGAHAYRVDLSQPLLRGVVEAGGQIRWVRGARHGLAGTEALPPDALDPVFVDKVHAAWMERAVHASFSRAIGRAATLEAGLRVSDSTLVRRRAIDRWLRGEGSIGAGWRIHGSTGVSYQFPGIEQIAGWIDRTGLRPERATSIDLGIGRSLTTSVRWDVTLFARQERDALREPALHPRWIDGALAIGDGDRRFENTLTGSARGVELTIARQSRTGLSGWIGYSYGRARYRDVERGDVFAADFDQRHAVNASGLVTLPWRTRLGLVFRGGTNVPIPGYLESRDGRLFAGSERNRTRLPAYARLDVRADRPFELRRRRVTAFVEVLNVLNRANMGPANGFIAPDTRQAVGFTERLFPRLATAGLRVEF